MSIWRFVWEGRGVLSYTENYSVLFAFKCCIYVMAALCFYILSNVDSRHLSALKLRLTRNRALNISPRWAIPFSLLLCVSLLLASPISGLLLVGPDRMGDYSCMCGIVVVLFTAFAFLTPEPSPFTRICSLGSMWQLSLGVSQFMQIGTMFRLVSRETEFLLALSATLPLTFAALYTYLSTIHNIPLFPVQPVLHLIRSNFMLWLILTATTSLGLVWVGSMAGVCIAPNASGISGPKLIFEGGRVFTTRLMRSYSPEHCGMDRDVCHVYLTAGEDLTSSVFINVHTPIGGHSDIRVELSELGKTDTPRILNAVKVETPSNLDHRDRRQVFGVYVEGLLAGMEYKFSLRSSEVRIGEESYFFRTASVTAVTFAIGGDSGTNPLSEQIFQHIAQTKPDVIVIGGDVAYDSGQISCACVWDDFLYLLDRHRIGGKHLTPLTFAVGNHDIGYNTLKRGDGGRLVSQEMSSCSEGKGERSIFFSWFPFEYDPVSRAPLAVCARSAKRVHVIPGLLNTWILDSGYTASPEENVDFVEAKMDNVLSHTNNTAVNIGVYHRPLYFPVEWNHADAASLREAWPSGIFDKFKFVANFEHHSHLYKRTKPMVNNAPAAGGTVYFGDGNIGAKDDEIICIACDTEGEAVFDKRGTETHFFQVKVEKSPSRSAVPHVDVRAIGLDGKIFDSWSNS